MYNQYIQISNRLLDSYLENHLSISWVLCENKPSIKICYDDENAYITAKKLLEDLHMTILWEYRDFKNSCNIQWD